MLRSIHPLNPFLVVGCSILLASMLAGCEDGPPKGSTMAGGSREASRDRLQDDELDPDLSEAEWGEIELSSQNRPQGQASESGSRASGGKDAPATATAAKPWTIVIATIGGDEASDRQKAAEALQRVRELSPEVASARLIPTRSGLLIGIGAYADARDIQAQNDLERIKNITARGGRPFATAVLSRVPTDTLPASTGKLHEHDLRGARLLFPNVDPLYTLQVGVWSDFESGEISADQVRRNAEKQTAELRSKGYDAYFYHDAERVISIITVGLFDKRALEMDEQLNTPVLSEEVEKLLREFPVHLVNGEPMQEPIARNKPSLGMRPQRCKLVLVP